MQPMVRVKINEELQSIEDCSNCRVATGSFQQSKADMGMKSNTYSEMLAKIIMRFI